MSNSESIYFSLKEACKCVGLGMSAGRNFFEKIGACRRIGRRVMVDKKVLFAALDNLESCKINNIMPEDKKQAMLEKRRATMSATNQ